MVALDGGVEAYVVHPPPPHGPPAGAIVFCHDIMGLRGGRTRHVCDDLAALTGCDVVCPNLFLEGPWATRLSVLGVWGTLKVLPSFLRWMVRQRAGPALRAVAAAVALYPEATPVGLFGTCYGGWVCLEAARRGSPLSARLRCIALAHPSPELALLHCQSPAALIRDLHPATPCLCVAAGNDRAMVHPGGLLEKSRAKGRGPEFVRVLAFSDQRHGWVSRGDWAEDPSIRTAYDAALGHAQRFFGAHMVTAG